MEKETKNRKKTSASASGKKSAKLKNYDESADKNKKIRVFCEFRKFREK